MAKRPHTLGDGPIEESLYELMIAVAAELDQVFNGEARGKDKKVGFVLLTFPYGSHDGRCNYISNGAERKDIVVMLKEQIARFEGQPELKGHA